jgi:cholesterol transport system auxiliary component
MTDRGFQNAILDRRAALRLLSGCGLVLIPGCSTVVGAGPPQLYDLSPPTAGKQTGGAQDGAPIGWSLAVAEPVAPQAFDTVRIALTRDPGTIDYFADAAWPDRAPPLLQGLIVDAFEDTGRIGAVGRDAGTFRSDFLLASELRAFDAHYPETGDPAPLIRVRLQAQLIATPSRDLVAATDIAESEAAAANTVPAAVQAFDAALARALDRLVVWTFATGEHAAKAGAP